MKEFKGTKGPWFEHREGFSTVYVEARLRDGVIQEVAACGPTEAGSEAQSANARLIAFAPNLLEELQQFQEISAQVTMALIMSGNLELADAVNARHPLRHAAIANALGE